MPEHPFLKMEMTRLDETRETLNKVRWDAEVEGTVFSLYIPKWRIPEPWPSWIWVRVLPCQQGDDDGTALSRKDLDKWKKFEAEV